MARHHACRQALPAEDEYYCDDCGHVGPGRHERSGLISCTRCRSVLLCQECGSPAEDDHICEYLDCLDRHTREAQRLEMVSKA